VNYLRWLASVLRSRSIPDDHLALSLDYLVETIGGRLSEVDAAALASVVANAKSALLDEAPAATSEIAAMPAAWEECDAFYDAMVSGDRLKALEIFRQAIAAGRGFIDTELHLVQPTFYRIGEGWQENKVSIAQEHLATVIAHSMLAREFAHAQPEPRVDRKAVLACVEGNHHALGLQMVADAFELQGWEVRNIGANTPTSALVGFVREDDPHLVGLSAAMPHHLPAARAAIARLRSELGEACPPLMLGGLAINQFKPLSKMLGADCTAGDARAAAEAASVTLG
jgi:MerR family transcriptional regulator, light-induced transcriptional regulator